MFPFTFQPTHITSRLSYLKIGPYWSLLAVCSQWFSSNTLWISERASEPVSTSRWHDIPGCMNRMSIYLQYLVFSFLETVYDSQSIAIVCHRTKQCHCATQSLATPPPVPSSVCPSLLLLQAIPRSNHPWPLSKDTVSLPGLRLS